MPVCRAARHSHAPCGAVRYSRRHGARECYRKQKESPCLGRATPIRQHHPTDHFTSALTSSVPNFPIPSLQVRWKTLQGPVSIKGCCKTSSPSPKILLPLCVSASKAPAIRPLLVSASTFQKTPHGSHRPHSSRNWQTSKNIRYLAALFNLIDTCRSVLF